MTELHESNQRKVLADETVASADSAPRRLRADRLIFLDALRGVAALAVAWLHFYKLTPLYEPLSRIFPAPLRWFCEHGGAGVQIFFVLSGFVIAYSVRDAVVTAGFFARFTLRRSIRLDPPYWFTLFLALLVMSLSGVVLKQAIALPGVGVITAHIFYLQNFFGFRNIVSQFWTLPYEVQFYLVFVGLFALSEKLACKGRPHRYGIAVGLAVSPIFLCSIYFTLNHISSHGWFLDRWYQFFLGAVTFWVLDERVSHIAWITSFLLVVFLAFFLRGGEPLIAALAAGTIYLVGLAGGLGLWLDWKWLQHLGRISYSFYLFHFVGATICKLGAKWTQSSEIGALLLFFAATLVSLAGAECMNRMIEIPSIRFSKRFKHRSPEGSFTTALAAP